MTNVLDKELMAQARQWRADNRQIAAAIVVQTWGSAPRPLGSRLLARDDGEFCGSVSGGCVEGEVIAAAAETLQTKRPQTLAFAVDDETAWGAGLSCGGEIAIWTHPLREENFLVANDIADMLEKRQSGVCVTRAADGAQQLADSGGGFPPDVIALAGRLGAENAAPQTMTAADGEMYFIEPFAPPPRLLIVGATHIAQSLSRLAETLEFAAVIVDPRAAWATAARFPGADLRIAWPDAAFLEMGVGRHDAVIALAHDPKIDDPALEFALAQATPFYVGALGSRKTHAKRIARLREKGLRDPDLRRIAAPIGLDIGAQGAAEIALSIAAEVLQTRRHAGTGMGGTAKGGAGAENRARAGARANIAGALLAAGESRRFGGDNKLLQKWRGEALLSRAAATLRAAAENGDLRHIVAVVGHDSDNTAPLLSGGGIDLIFNPDHPSGIASSLRLALGGLDGDIDAALIFLADMPAVTPGDIAALVAAFRREKADIVIPTCGGKRGNPVLLARSQFPRAMRLQGDAGARAFFDDAKTLTVEIGAAALFDIDEPARLAASPADE